jgi:hypothetical protein
MHLYPEYQFFKNTKLNKVIRVHLVVECVPSKHRALSSNHNAAKKKKNSKSQTHKINYSLEQIIHIDRKQVLEKMVSIIII